MKSLMKSLMKKCDLSGLFEAARQRKDDNAAQARLVADLDGPYQKFVHGMKVINDKVALPGVSITQKDRDTAISFLGHVQKAAVDMRAVVEGYKDDHPTVAGAYIEKYFGDGEESFDKQIAEVEGNIYAAGFVPLPKVPVSSKKPEGSTLG